MVRALLVLGSLSACAPTMAPTDPATRLRELPDDGDLLGLVPGDAEMVLTVDVAQLRSSRWSRDLLKTRDTSLHGFDVAKDVDRLVMARLSSTNDEASFTVAQGRFDRERVATEFRKQRPAATQSRVRGCSVWADERDALAFLTDRTVVSGPLAAVRGSIDASLGRAPSARQQSWITELEVALVAGRGRPSHGPAASVAVHVTDPVRAQLRETLDEAEGLERLGLRLDLGQTLDLAAVGVARSPREASALAGTLDTLLHGLRARVSLAALGLLPVLQRARVSAQGARVTGELHLNEEQREEIAARLTQLAEVVAAARKKEPK